EPFDDRARDRGAAGSGDGIRRLELAVRVHELVPLDQGRQVGLVRHVEEDGEDSDEEGEHVQVGNLEKTGEAEECDGGDDGSPTDVRKDQDGPPLSSIYPHADQEAEQEEGKGACGAQKSVLK